MPGQLILFDLDETLINTEYHLTVPEVEVRQAFARAIQRGAVIGLNSDSPEITLRDWHERLGLNGPIISERGALVRLPGATESEVVVPIVARQIPLLRDRLVEILRERADLEVKFGQMNDLDEIVRRATEQHIVVVNPWRVCSFGSFVRERRADGSNARDPVRTEELGRLLGEIAMREFPSLWSECELDVNLRYAVCILHLRTTQKLGAARWLIDRLGCRALFMVGNSMSDYLDDERVIHGAVANASEEFKASAHLVATRSLTAGAVELLEAFVGG